MTRNLFARKPFPTAPTKDPKIIRGWSFRPWWYNAAQLNDPCCVWHVLPKGAGPSFTPWATIRRTRSGMYIVEANRYADDAFISWREAATEAIDRAENRKVGGQ